MSAARVMVPPELTIKDAVTLVEDDLVGGGYSQEAATKIAARGLAEALGRQIGRIDCTLIQFERMLLDFQTLMEDAARNTVASAGARNERR